MALTVDDLQPKNFKIILDGELELDCRPPKLSHILGLSKLGDIFSNPKNYNRQQITQAEQDFEWILGDLVPALKGKSVEFKYITEIISQIMQNVSPEENVELEQLGVKVDSDPKAEGRG